MHGKTRFLKRVFQHTEGKTFVWTLIMGEGLDNLGVLILLKMSVEKFLSGLLQIFH